MVDVPESLIIETSTRMYLCAKAKTVVLDLHLKIIEPSLVLQAVIELISSMPERKIRKALLIPGYGLGSSSSRAGIQSCLVGSLLSIANIKIDRLEGKYRNLLDYHCKICS